MVYRMANGSVGSIDYREKAPLAASKDMYLDENGEFLSNLSTKGALHETPDLLFVWNERQRREAEQQFASSRVVAALHAVSCFVAARWRGCARCGPAGWRG